MSIKVKTVFYTLFFVIITVFVLSTWLIFFYPTADHIIVSNGGNNSSARFQVTTQKNELEKLINTYLHEQVESNGLNFSINLDNDLQFQGDVHILGMKAPVNIGFEPVLQPNGDLVLKQQYFQVGALSLPASIVLEYVNRSYTFPEWIILQPLKKEIYIASTSMGSDSKARIHVNKFNLVEDEFQFDVYLSDVSQ